MVAVNYGDGSLLRDVLQDWFAFLGGKPCQVIVLDNGSTAATREATYGCFKDGLIDKLLLITPGDPDVGKHQTYIAENTVGAIAYKPYLLFFKVDCLPYREGHDEWLAEAFGFLERSETFAVGGSFNKPAFHHEAWPGWYFSARCSLNFALMKRERFMAALEESCGGYIASGIRGDNPSGNRHLVEVSFARYMAAHNLYTLVRVEDPTWTVFHTNAHEARLAKTRADYLARRRIERYLNCGMDPDPGLHRYYGGPRGPLVQRLRLALSRSPLGPPWRALRRRLIGVTRATGP
jgi:hypothetical protein